MKLSNVKLCLFVFRDVIQENGGKWKKAREMKCNEKARAQIPASSAGEDRAILLGFTMMAFSILTYFLVGIVMVKPSLYRLASVLQVDCLLIEYFKCLRVWVNSTPEKTLQLYRDEDTVKYRPKVGYCRQCDLITLSFIPLVFWTMIMLKYTVQMALYYLLWPSLMLFGGILLVGLVKLNQHLSFLCLEAPRSSTQKVV
uniref:Si:ch211-38m6.7 n=1 Tax=Cyprinus carpio TaxID=7962 RepID=A0A8C2JEY0_CYPCA